MCSIMRGFLFFAVLNALIPGFVQGADPEDAVEKVERLDSVVVSSSRAGKDTPVTFTMIQKEESAEFTADESFPAAFGCVCQ